MPKFSANLGFLWADASLPIAIRKAAAAGFDAVECHFPYDEDLEAIRAVLQETRLPMLGINTRRGNDASGRFGLAALPARQQEAREGIDEAIETALFLGAVNVHVMAGAASGPEARKVFVDNLTYASTRAEAAGISILIEPLNPYDASGYFHTTTGDALEIIETVGRNNLKLMFDCYHVGRTEAATTDALIKRLEEVRAHIGHIQFAAVPDRGAPDHGVIDYKTVFSAIDAMEWNLPLGAEYRPPDGDTDASLGWMTG